MDKDNGKGFREVQRFRQIWMWAIVVLTTLMLWAGAIAVFFKAVPADPPTRTLVAVLWAALGIGLPGMLFLLRLETEVRGDGVYFRFSPIQIQYRRIGFDEMKSFKSVTYQPILDYGGWGIRRGPKGKAYNVSGNLGVMFELRNGKSVLIGSAKPRDIVECIKAAKLP